MRVDLIAEHERWTLKTPFSISREQMTDASLLVVRVTDGTYVGRGEACPAPHFGETIDRSLAQLAALGGSMDPDIDVAELLPAGSARNALDCACWDYRAKRQGVRVWDLMHRPKPWAVETVFTISLSSPGEMAEAAKAARQRILKLKLGREGDLERVAAVRRAVPDKRLIVDVNEGWTIDDLAMAMPELHRHAVELIEQPLPADQDGPLADIERLVPVGADESCHTTEDLDRVAGLYDVINIKLDKVGGLTEGFRLLEDAKARGLRPMVGCMLGTSLAMAPAILVAQDADWVDLDAPLLMGSDRPHGLVYRDGVVLPPARQLWG